MLTNYMDMCVDQDIAVFIGGLALIDRRIAVLNVSQDQCPWTHMPSRVRVRSCHTQRPDVDVNHRGPQRVKCLKRVRKTMTHFLLGGVYQGKDPLDNYELMFKTISWHTQSYLNTSLFLLCPSFSPNTAKTCELTHQHTLSCLLRVTSPKFAASQKYTVSDIYTKNSNTYVKHQCKDT